jgi:hypothetical protein
MATCQVLSNGPKDAAALIERLNEELWDYLQPGMSCLD